MMKSEHVIRDLALVGCLVATAPLMAACGSVPEEADHAPSVGATAPARSEASIPPRAVVGPHGETLYFEAAAARIDGGGRLDLHRRTDAGGIALTGTPLPGLGLGAPDLQDAYGVPISRGANPPTVAIIGNADDPALESDLGVYRTQYGMPACTTANGCFRKVNENGLVSPLPAAAPTNSPIATWATELANDVEMVSATCPGCNILVVLWSTSVETAWQTAVSLGATYVSNSFVFTEGSGWATHELADESGAWFNQASFFASSGDGAFSGGTWWPSVSARVTAVGGTVLTPLSASPWWSQSAWGGAGSGCSLLIPRPSWQADVGCGSFRATADVSALASDNVLYDSWSSNGWVTANGTSISSPLVAGLYATLAWTGAAPSFSYTHAYAFIDVTTGSNGTCSTADLCTAQTGWDGPTGNGTPWASASHMFYANPSTVSLAAGSFTYVDLFSNYASAAESCTVVAASLPAGMTGTCEPNVGGGLATLQAAGTVAPQTVVATVVANWGTFQRATEVVVDVTACQPATCASADACNTSISDGCGHTLTCGGCSSGQSCYENGCCVPESASVACAGGACGIVGAGCGTTVNCGTCPGPLKCRPGFSDCGGYCCHCSGGSCS